VKTALNVRRIGDLVSTIGTSAFGTEYFRLFNEALAIEHCTVFAFRDGAQPAALVTECSGQDSLVRRLAHEYVAGAFRKDPNIRRELVSSAPLIYTLRAEDVRDADYRHHFYDEPSLSHELVLLGNVGGTLFYSSFYRCRAERHFAQGDLDTVQLLSYIAFKALQRHVELQHTELPTATTLERDSCPASEDGSGGPFAQRREAFLHLRSVLLRDCAKLSPREADVGAAIVLGYSTLAISLNLGISLNTVATHRKRAYSKLGISSQTELFGLYFRNVSSHSQRSPAGITVGTA
jgi:DNA-binding CsgD family transcriptional regulator